MKRLFIEIDAAKPSVLRSIELACVLMHDLRGYEGDNVNTFFDTIIDNAHGKMPQIIAALSSHEEIYASTAFIPRGNITSGDMFNALMKYAIENHITDKRIYLLREIQEVKWQNLDKKLLKQCFKSNYLFVEGLDKDGWVQVDIDKLIKERF